MSDYFTGPTSAAAPAPSLPTPGTWGPAQPSGWGPPPGGGYPRLLPPPPPNRGKQVIVVVACVIGGLFVLGILAAIAVPTFLAQKEKARAAATTVSLPEEILGQPRFETDIARQMQQQLDAVLPAEHYTGFYGSEAAPQVMVVVGRTNSDAQAQRNHMANLEAGARRSQALSFVDIPPGRLGGQVRCAAIDGGSFCFFVDAGAIGVVMLYDTMGQDLTLVNQVREAVEHRD